MLLKYFSNISDLQRRQFEDLEPLYREWNAKINVVSRKDIDNLMLHHVLHSLAIAKAFEPAGAAGSTAFHPAGASVLPAFEPAGAGALSAFESAGAGAMSAFGPAGAAGSTAFGSVAGGGLLPAFEDGDRVLDVGTGGGFPGIPLAILFPGVKFTLCDSVGKKLIVAEAVAKALGLDNVEVVHSRVEDLIKAQLGKGQAKRRAQSKGDKQLSGDAQGVGDAQASAGAAFSFVVSRAVTDLSNFLPWVKGGYSKGIYYLKGGDVTDAPLFADRGALLQEIDVALKKNGLSRDNVKIFNICDAFEEEFFEQKRVLFISDKKF